MKIAFGSDLHLEFGRGQLVVPEGIDLLVLAGDIFVPWPNPEKHAYWDNQKLTKRFLNFFAEVSKAVPHTALVMGNHEHYLGNLDSTVNYGLSKPEHWVLGCGFAGETAAPA